MTTFHALNVESDDESDIEIDNTKEIQIEEALKIYQTALKHHSQGPQGYEEAREAYKNLFESDIFKYPESRSEYERLETFGELEEVETHGHQPLSIPPLAVTETVDNAPSTLPQILHLSYKNRGRFHLDVLLALLKEQKLSQQVESSLPKTKQHQIVDAAIQAIRDFAEALDKDEEDIDLWRRAAKVGAALGSLRISRYSLEAALDGEDEGVQEVVGIPGIEEELAAHDLRHLMRTLGDDLFPLQSHVSQPSASGLPGFLKRQLELYAFLPEPATDCDADTKQQDARRIVSVARKTWSDVGQGILRCIEAEQLPKAGGPATWIKIECAPPDNTTLAEHHVERQKLAPTDSQHKPTMPSPKDVNGDLKIEAPQSPAVVFSSKDLPIVQGIAASSGQGAEAPIEVTLPTRKRSSETAELPDAAEGGRIRSKRLRARESIADDGGSNRPNGIRTKQVDHNQLQEFVQADQYLFEVSSYHAARLGVEIFPPELISRDLVNEEAVVISSPAEESLQQARRDFYDTLKSWTEEKAQIFMQSDSADELDASTRNKGLEAFLEHSKAGKRKAAEKVLLSDGHGLDEFIKHVNSGWFDATEAAFLWLQCLIRPNESATDCSETHSSAYLEFLWSDALKRTVSRTLTVIDNATYRRMLVAINKIDKEILNTMSSDHAYTFTTDDNATVDMIETLFELHLDEYSRLTSPASKADATLQHLQKIRMDRWSQLAREAINLRPRDNLAEIEEDSITVRHIWASVFHLQSYDNVSRDYILSCIENLKQIFESTKISTILLQNNVAMPELSAAATEREVSKLMTMDFFLGIFDKANKEPVDLIEALEPLLESSLRHETNGVAFETATNINGSSATLETQLEDVVDEIGAIDHSPLQQMTRFIRNAALPLRLSLWERLRESYEAIDYPPKVLSIYLRCIEIMVRELISISHFKKTKEQREEAMLKSLRSINGMLLKVLDIINANTSAFDCTDIHQIKISLNIIADLACLLHVVSMFDDFNQINYQGSPPMNPFKYYNLEAFNLPSTRFHDMQIRIWVLLYHLIKQGMVEVSEEFPSALEDKVNILRNIHYAFGTRRLCKAADGLLLNLMKDEFLTETELNPQSVDDLSQVLYDLYDLQCFTTPLARHDHGCESDYLNRTTALQLIDFVLSKARSVSIKDLIKSDLGKTIEKMHTALVHANANKSTPATIRNNKVCVQFLKSPLHPIELFQCLQGIGDISTSPVSANEAVVASKGWFFIKGYMELMRFRSQRSKAAAGPTEDLHVAIAFFIQDLEYTTEKWETWYRLAQAYDTLVDEGVFWSAEKVITNQEEIAQHERSAIHAYTMAIATALRSENSSEPSSRTLSDLYGDFANRVYSSTTPPFNLKAFSLTGFPDKPASRSSNSGLYHMQSFGTLTHDSAYRFAASLYKRALISRGDYWWYHFMLGKCIWKMTKRLRASDSERLPAYIQITLECFREAINKTPERKDVNKQDPILEPIYKLVSMVWKMFEHDDLPAQAGCAWIETALQEQRQFEARVIEKVTENREFSGYVLEVLKMLRHIDKAHWHHRLVFRAARLMYPNPTKDDPVSSQSTKEYLMEEHMFSSKTMWLSIWKPDNERSGRRWVYTSDYYEFMMNLLRASKDRDSIVLMARRIRKKASEFLDHTKMWQMITSIHLKIFRDYGAIPYNLEAKIFRDTDMTQDEFSDISAKVDEWCAAPETSHPLLEVLRETAELKKLNVGLGKIVAVDDLLADTYAAVWLHIRSAREPQSQVKTSLQPPSSAGTPVHQRTPEPTGQAGFQPAQNLGGVPITNGFVNADVTNELRMLPHFEGNNQDHFYKMRMPKLVSKRDIVRRAEASFVRSAAPSTNAKSAQRTLDSDIRVSTPTRDMDLGDDSGAMALSSVPGSVHDSADDESELSEIEDEPAIPESMFPNLRRTESTAIHKDLENKEDVGEAMDVDDEDDEELHHENHES